MKKLLFGTLFVSLLGALYYHSQERTFESADAPRWIRVSEFKKDRPLFSRWAQTSVLEIPSIPNPRKVPTKCVLQWISLVQTDVLVSIASLQNSTMTFDDECLAFEKEVNLSAETHAACQHEPGDHFAYPDACLRNLKLFRASLTDRLSLDETNYAKFPIGVLINKFVARMTTTGERDLPELRKIAEQIKALHPDHPATYKLFASLEMVAEIPNVQIGAEYADAGLQLDPRDQDLQNFWFYFKSKDLNFDYDEFVDDNSEYPYGAYFQAGRYWHTDKQAEALILLGDLIQKNPHIDQFKDTLRKAQEEPSSAINPFAVSFDITKDNW